eukprot:392356-Pyramimonas_sp.AAC.1
MQLRIRTSPLVTPYSTIAPSAWHEYERHRGRRPGLEKADQGIPWGWDDKGFDSRIWPRSPHRLKLPIGSRSGDKLPRLL